MDNFWLGVLITAILCLVVRLCVDDFFDFIGACFALAVGVCFVVLIISGSVVLFKSAFLGG